MIATETLTFEDVLTAFISAEQDATSALFEQGDVLIAAVQQLHQLNVGTQADLLRAIGERTSTSRRALMYRLNTSRTFLAEDRLYPISWNTYRVAATSDDPHKWAEYAADNNLSAEKLRQAIKHARGESPNQTRIVFPLRNEPVCYVSVPGHRAGVTFEFNRTLTEQECGWLLGSDIQLTVSVEVESEG